MNTPSDTIYVLSATCRNGDGDGSMYIRGTHEFGDDKLNTITVTVAVNIENAKVFYSRQEAWNYREDIPSNAWQITPISAKTLFTKKLKSK